KRQRIADGEPGVLGAVLALELAVPRAAGAHQPRAHGRYHNAAAGQLRAQALREAGHGKLADAVGQQVRHADLAADGADVDDAALAAAAHAGQRGLDGVVRAPEVDRQRLLEVAAGHGVQRTDADNARV